MASRAELQARLDAHSSRLGELQTGEESTQRVKKRIMAKIGAIKRQLKALESAAPQKRDAAEAAAVPEPKKPRGETKEERSRARSRVHSVNKQLQTLATSKQLKQAQKVRVSLASTARPRRPGGRCSAAHSGRRCGWTSTATPTCSTHMCGAGILMAAGRCWR